MTYRPVNSLWPRLSRKSRNHEARLSYHGNVLMDNRSGLIVDLLVDQSSGYAELHFALALRPDAGTASTGSRWPG